MAPAPDRVKGRRWTCLCREQRASGESVAAFCRQRQIPVPQFYWWQRLLRKRAVQDADEPTLSPAAFVPVRVSLVSPMIEMIHPGGCIVRVVAGEDVQALRNVFAVLTTKTKNPSSKKRANNPKKVTTKTTTKTTSKKVTKPKIDATPLPDPALAKAF